jgi:Ion channel
LPDRKIVQRHLALMSKSTISQFRYWSGIIGPLAVVYTVVGLLVDMAVPQILPDNALTASVGDAAKSGAFAIWLYLLWRIFNTIRGIYGPDSIHYLERTPIWRILLDVIAAYSLAIFCFSVLYVYLVRRDEAAFSEVLKLSNALYFSIVTMTTTGYGDISPKSGWARFLVSIQILFGFFYNVLFFSIFAGLAGRRKPN